MKYFFLIMFSIYVLLMIVLSVSNLFFKNRYRKTICLIASMSLLLLSNAPLMINQALSPFDIAIDLAFFNVNILELCSTAFLSLFAIFLYNCLFINGEYKKHTFSYILLLVFSVFNIGFLFLPYSSFFSLSSGSKDIIISLIKLIPEFFILSVLFFLFFFAFLFKGKERLSFISIGLLLLLSCDIFYVLSPKILVNNPDNLSEYIFLFKMLASVFISLILLIYRPKKEIPLTSRSILKEEL